MFGKLGIATIALGVAVIGATTGAILHPAPSSLKAGQYAACSTPSVTTPGPQLAPPMPAPTQTRNVRPEEPPAANNSNPVPQVDAPNAAPTGNPPLVVPEPPTGSPKPDSRLDGHDQLRPGQCPPAPGPSVQIKNEQTCWNTTFVAEYIRGVASWVAHDPFTAAGGSPACFFGPSGNWKLVMQGDGNFVMYSASDGFVYWSTGTYGHPGARLEAHTNGNLVVYAPAPSNAVLWQSGSIGLATPILALQNDRNVVRYGWYNQPPTWPANWYAYWATNTSNGLKVLAAA